MLLQPPFGAEAAEAPVMSYYILKLTSFSSDLFSGGQTDCRLGMCLQGDMEGDDDRLIHLLRPPGPWQ